MTKLNKNKIEKKERRKKENKKEKSINITLFQGRSLD